MAAGTRRNVKIYLKDNGDVTRSVTITGVRSGLTSGDVKPLAQALIDNTQALKHTYTSIVKGEIVTTTTTNLNIAD